MFYNLSHYISLVLGPEPLRRLNPGLTLEIGSGAFPSWQADVLCDRHVSDTSHRSSRALLVDHRPMVVCDAARLPFQDKAFDFVVARHVLEHVSDPEIVLREMGRVARNGYIECPSPLAESLLGWPKHVWTVGLDEKGLILRPAPTHSLGTLFHDLYASDRRFAAFHDARPDLFRTQYLWSDSPRWTALGEPLSIEEVGHAEPDALPSPNVGAFPLDHRLWHAASMIVRRARRRTGPRSLASIVHCPRCQAELSEEPGGFRCRACQKKYPAHAGNYTVLTPEWGGTC
jgi:SAM-dependent methyltransferase